MRLERNKSDDGKCKYALIERMKGNKIEYGLPNTESEFFVIKLHDKYAREALLVYADKAEEDDPEYAKEVRELADRSSELSKWCKRPD